MRLSLLLQREPFAGILERTMSAYWSAGQGNPVEVRWGKSDSRRQVWRGNVYLNFFATADTPASAFEVLVREFGHSRAAWRRPIQRGYVHAAVRMPWRRFFSQVCFDVTPAVPEASGQVLVGGNHRLRLIVPRAARSIVLHKQGFDTRGMAREIAARRSAASAVSPRLLQVADDELSFEEAYIEGTPINRLGGVAEQDCRIEALHMLTERVHGPTAQISSVEELGRAAAVVVQDCVRLGENGMTGPLAAELMARVESIVAEAERVAGSAEVPAVLSHGDFQEANVLRVNSGLVIIDWENAIRRSAFYDLVTMYSGLRLSADWVGTWANLCSGWQNLSQPPFRLWAGADWSPAMRRGLALLWALEEAAFRAEDVVMSPQSDAAAAWAGLGGALGRVLKSYEVFGR